MFKDMNKFEKAGLIIGGLECVAGFAVAMYMNHKLKKQAKEHELELLKNTAETMKFMDSDLRD